MMASRRCFRAALASSGSLMASCRPAPVLANAARVCTATTSIRRDLSLAAAARQHVAASKYASSATTVVLSGRKEDHLDVKFGDGTVGHLPFVWLRDNCQCSECFSNEAQGRKLLLEDLDVDVYPTAIQESYDKLRMEWSDGHTSEYDAHWLQERAFTPTSRAVQRVKYAMQREPWGADHHLKEYDYNTLISNEQVLLDWLITMERRGSAMLKNAPKKDVAGPELIEHIAYVKKSHYGPHSPVINRPNTNNVAFTNAKLGMHNDLPQYEHMPGIIFIQCVEQHVGTGGESVVSDGLYAAELLRRKYPEDFHTLTSTDIYFWDKGHANYDWEMEEFFKISKFPVIKVNSSNEVVQVAVNNAIRDSHLDIPASKVKDFYKAFKRYHDVLYENAITFKMDAGDMMTLDNVRCLHGREGYEATSGRHIESSYLDWDEARCRRRRLQEKFGY